MRTLGVLVALQCAGVAFLVYRSLGAPSGSAPAAPALVTAPLPQPVPPATADEQRLRQIIREELAALAIAGTAPAGPMQAAAPRDPERDRAQREYVAAQIAHYRSVGRISDAEMQNLQQDIARLGPADRKAMLATLVQAMNAREIQGQM